jgi:hypothetical protein
VIVPGDYYRPLAESASNDPFAALLPPPELRYHILSYLPGQEILAFRNASPAILDATNSINDLFWRNLIARDMSWFWELHGLVVDCRARDRVLFLWLDKTTRSCFGNDSPFLRLANRRRIWGGFERLAEFYFRRMTS